MWKAGLTDYADFAKRLLERITAHPISFEVFADDADEMRRQAHRSPPGATTSTSRSPSRRPRRVDGAARSRALRERRQGERHALFTTAQVELITAAVKDGLRRTSRCSPGGSPMPGSIRCRSWPAPSTSWSRRRASELIWASPREILNVVQADQIGCHIITITADLYQADTLGKDLAQSRSRRCRCSAATRSPRASRL